MRASAQNAVSAVSEEVSGSHRGITFGNLLAQYRRSHMLSQEDLALRAGLSDRTVRNIERGWVRRPHPSSVHRLADALDLKGAGRDQFEDAALANRVDQPKAPGSSLPAAVWPVVGREDDLAYLRSVLRRGPAAAPWTVALAGPGGIGKTAVAVHLARDLADRYTDAQLYVCLRSRSGPLSVPDILHRLLSALGVVFDPSEDQWQLRRRFFLAADRLRLLVVLDDADNENQIRQTLPTGSGCAAIVTSRRPMPTIAAAPPHRLGPLNARNSLQLLSELVGHATVRRNLAAARTIVAACEGNPLALRLAASRLASRRPRTIDDLANRLADPQRRLDELRVGEVQMRSAIGHSYDSLPGHVREGMLRLAGFKVSDYSEELALELIGFNRAISTEVLDHLVDAQLVDIVRSADQGAERFVIGGLVRLFLEERLRVEHTQSGPTAGVVNSTGINPW